MTTRIRFAVIFIVLVSALGLATPVSLVLYPSTDSIDQQRVRLAGVYV